MVVIPYAAQQRSRGPQFFPFVGVVTTRVTVAVFVAGGAARVVVEEEAAGGAMMAGTAGPGTGADGEEEDGRISSMI